MSGDHPNAYKARVNKMFVLILILSLFSDEIKLEPFLLSLSPSQFLGPPPFVVLDIVIQKANKLLMS